MHSSWRTLFAGTLSAAFLLLTVGCGTSESTTAPSVSSSPSSSSSSESSTPSATPSESAQQASTDGEENAHTVLETLEVKGRAPKTGYSRDQFGTAWSDVDHNGCDTRNDILNRDLTNTTHKENTHECVVTSGVLADPYTGQQINFTRGQDTSTAVQIDHVVALSNAWQTGAQQLSEEERTQFANDPYNLLAVDGPANQQKSDGDAATWLPSNTAFRCEYVARQIGVKKKYSLWVTQAEHDAMSNILATCPTQTVPTDDGVITPITTNNQPSETVEPQPTQEAPVPEQTEQPVAPTQPESTPQTESQDNTVYYKNCTAVRAAGKAPLYKGEPGYSTKLDRDGDGIACE